MCGFLRRGAVLILLLPVLLAISACGKGPEEPTGKTEEPPVKEDLQPKARTSEVPQPESPDAAKLAEAAGRVRAGKSTTIDVRSYPKIGDRDLHLLRGLANLVDLNLDNSAVSNEGMKEVAALAGLKILSLSNTQVTDEGVANLKSLTSLESLRLDQLRFTDAGMAHLEAFPRLKKLSLWRTQITDKGLVHLKPLVMLEEVSLDETRVSDEGLKELYGLTRLRRLKLWQTRVSENGMRELKEKLPKVKVSNK